MYKNSGFTRTDLLMILAIIVLISLSVFVLRSVAVFIFPHYFIYILLASIFLYIFTRVDFEILTIFSTHLYVLSIFLLILPLLIGQVTRGAIRWIPLGSLTIQPSEVTRAFLLIFFANYITSSDLNVSRLIKLFVYLFIPFILILIQPSLGVALLTIVGFLGVMLASSIEKKYFLFGIIIFLLIFPSLWFALRPYQKQRIVGFLNPSIDPLGSGYNSIQSMISVGSGGLFGRGLGEGVQTQLFFLPEKHSDFIFAAVSEELGMIGALILILGLFTIFWVLIHILSQAKNPTARAYVSGVFLVLFVQSFIHIGMNMGILPITGVTLPFVSAGGSALLGTTISVAIAMNAKKDG